MHEAPGLARRVEVARVLRCVRDQTFEVCVLDEEALAVLLEKDTDPSDGRRRVEEERVGDHGVEVEELDHLQRAPDLLPAAAEHRRMKYVHHRALAGADAHASAPAGHLVVKRVVVNEPEGTLDLEFHDLAAPFEPLATDPEDDPDNKEPPDDEAPTVATSAPVSAAAMEASP